MASHLTLLKEGIEEGNWEKVCRGYYEVTGEKCQVPNETENLSNEINHTLYKRYLVSFLQSMIQMINQDEDELPEELELVHDQTNLSDIIHTSSKVSEPKYEDIVVSNKIIDSDDLPDDNPLLYANVPKKEKKESKIKMIKLQCQTCGVSFHREKELIFSDSRIECDQCMNKKPQNIKRYA